MGPTKQGPFPLQIVQVAYHVRDVAQSAAAMAAEFGIGPFFLAEHIPVTRCVYRGEEVKFDHSSAYGQSGSVMMELVQQHGTAPSAVRDMFGPDDEGLHHVACFVDDLDAAIDHYASIGCPLAQRATVGAGTDFIFVDGRSRFGHMVELYEPSPILTGFYDMVRSASVGWDGRDPVRSLGSS